MKCALFTSQSIKSETLFIENAQKGTLNVSNCLLSFKNVFEVKKIYIVFKIFKYFSKHPRMNGFNCWQTLIKLDFIKHDIKIYA